MKRLIIIRGSGGSGKTTVTKILAENLRRMGDVAVLPVDLFNFDISGRRPKGDIVYEVLNNLSLFYLQREHDVIIEGILIAQKDNGELNLNDIVKRAKGKGAKVYVFKLIGDLEVLAEREIKKFKEMGWEFKKEDFAEWHKLALERKHSEEKLIDVTSKSPEEVASIIYKSIN